MRNHPNMLFWFYEDMIKVRKCIKKFLYLLSSHETHSIVLTLTVNRPFLLRNTSTNLDLALVVHLSALEEGLFLCSSEKESIFDDDDDIAKNLHRI